MANIRTRLRIVSVAKLSVLCLMPILAWAGRLAAPQDGLSGRIDRIFQEWNRPDSPGASVAVIKDGRIVLSRGYGSANLEYGVPITSETVFHVASVSKQFTAMALVLLEQDGKLALEDDIHKHLPELPEYGHKITVRHLLQHTSGIRDQWQTLAIAGWRLDDVITQAQILRVLCRQKELNFTPGTEHLYSNGGYTLAAEIVRRVSGKTLRAFCEERIFKPLGMTRTHFHDDLKMIVKNRAVSYGRAGSGFENAPLNYENTGATSLFTTAEDLARWLDNFREPKVGGPAGVARLQEQAVLADGEGIPYALGVAVDEYRGLKRVSHGGGDAGYRSMVAWFPELKLGIALVSNLGSFNPGQKAQEVAEAVAEDRMKPKAAVSPAAAAKPVVPIKVDPQTLARYAGVYRVPGLGVVEVEFKDNKLVASHAGEVRRELIPLAQDKFLVEPMNLEVSFQMEGGKMQMTIRPLQGQTEMRGERLAETAAMKEPNLASYAGVYWSDELETQYTALVEDGKLRLRHIRHGDTELRPVASDMFSTGTWFMSEIRFVRDAGGQITGMRAGGGRIRGILFARR